MKPLKIQWTWNKILAIIVLIILIILSTGIIPSIVVWYNQNNELQKERAFHITFAHNLNLMVGNYENETADITIDLLLICPRGTIIVDDPIRISGVVVLNEQTSKKITNGLSIYLQNAQAYPITQNDDDITQGQNIKFYNRIDENRLIGNTTIIWSLEGSYYPMLAYELYNETGQGERFIGTSDVKITVYPKSELAQIITNNVQMIFTIALYLLTVAGTGSLILSLWDREKPDYKKERNREQSCSDTKINQKNGERKTNIKINTEKTKKTGKKKSNNTHKNNT